MAREGLAGGEAVSLRPTLFAIAFALLVLDSLVVLFMNGAFSRMPKGSRGGGRPNRGAATAAAIAAIAFGLLAFAPGQGLAQEMAPGAGAKPGDAQILERLDTTHLAYVVTGEADVDRLSDQGLAGLSEFLSYRTTLEPGAPVGLDISKDELSFFPIIYWPVSATAPMPSQAAISRIDAYMRNGGTVLFDTRDQYSSLDGGGTTPNGERLQAILANIDIPPLEPTPKDHVLTRSFYLLANFPGRYTGSPLWVEARQDAKTSGAKLTSSGDGVTPLLITGNDFCRRLGDRRSGRPRPADRAAGRDAARIRLPRRRQHHDVHADRQLQSRPGPRPGPARTAWAVREQMNNHPSSGCRHVLPACGENGYAALLSKNLKASPLSAKWGKSPLPAGGERVRVRGSLNAADLADRGKTS